MALTQENVIDRIEFVGEHRHMQIREATVIKEDGKEISRSFKRRVLMPDADVTGENAEVQAVTAAVWTLPIKAAHQALVNARRNQQP